jgi:hypothetical protein
MFLGEKGKKLTKLSKILIFLQYVTFVPIIWIIARISMAVQIFLMFLKRRVPTMSFQELHFPWYLTK